MRLQLVGNTRDGLKELAASLGHPHYRGRQLADWVYKRSARSVDEMTDLPKALRAELQQRAEHPLVRESAASFSDDGTTKFLLDLTDGLKVECVYLPYEDRTSVCVSTQVGCAMDCQFCATGIGGLLRDLTAGEIVDQVLHVQSATGKRVTNVVYMGMGEPLANFRATVDSIRLLATEVGISARKVTVSTVGLPQAIRALAAERLPVTLAVSLHAADDETRSRLMPAARLHPLSGLLDACRHWVETTGRKMTFEYLLLQGVNDTPAHARRLADCIRHPLMHVNLIPYNHVEGRGSFKRPGRDAVERFRSELERAGVPVTERMRRGNPIDAACGQLRRSGGQGPGRSIQATARPGGVR